MNKNLKRIVAYMIDTILISAVAFFLTNVKQINFQLDNYEKAYKSYEKVVDKYQDLQDEYEDAKEDYEEEEITKKEYKKIKKGYEDYEITYTKSVKKYNYELSKNSLIATLISLALIIAYFGIFQYSMNGQTLGKKIMKLRVVSNKDVNLNLLNYVVRCVVLNGAIFNIALMICVYLFNYKDFYTANYIVSNISSIVEIIILMMIFMNKDGRGLHDYLAGTKVIEMDNEGHEIEYIPPTKKDDE